MSGCTSCASKGGCDTRKDGMFSALAEMLERLYPTRTWGELDDEVALESGVGRGVGPRLARQLAEELGTAAYFERGGPEELCDYVWVLCLGREPSLWQMRAGRAAVESDKISEVYLRIALSAVAPMVAVQQVLVQLRPRGDRMMYTEEPRGGVFDAELLGRFQRLVGVLGDHGLQHLDFGEITNPPEGFSPGSHAAAQGADEHAAAPAIVNYLFYPQSPTAVVTRYLCAAASSRAASLTLS